MFDGHRKPCPLCATSWSEATLCFVDNTLSVRGCSRFRRTFARIFPSTENREIPRYFSHPVRLPFLKMVTMDASFSDCGSFSVSQIFSTRRGVVTLVPSGAGHYLLTSRRRNTSAGSRPRPKWTIRVPPLLTSADVCEVLERSSSYKFTRFQD